MKITLPPPLPRKNKQYGRDAMREYVICTTFDISFGEEGEIILLITVWK